MCPSPHRALGQWALPGLEGVERVRSQVSFLCFSRRIAAQQRFGPRVIARQACQPASASSQNETRHLFAVSATQASSWSQACTRDNAMSISIQVLRPGFQ